MSSRVYEDGDKAEDRAENDTSPAEDGIAVALSGIASSESGAVEDDDAKHTSEDVNDDRVAEGTGLDEVLLLALTHPRDRMLLLRAEVEMDKFVASSTQVLSSLYALHELR